MLMLEKGNVKWSDEMKLTHNKKIKSPSEQSVQSKSEV